ncbi:TonB-dependent receptor [Croceicoccus bisphenolivorans]|uniref:TonB-dependent receptor n=1 Tax=Croceicoccus bisphenolivorans TaxID=1783232 RepID=UPI000A8DAB2C|nr:TonB-dependent receptor [Croceicoccus bisphenolivorans]
MSINKSLLVSTILAMGAVALPATGYAQDSDDNDTTAEGGLAEIVVTAQRREESLQKAALAITAVDSESLARAAITDTAGLVRVAPALQISTIGGSATQFYLRGVGNFTTNSNSDAAVSVAVNGVTIARSSAVQGMFYDLQRVEVLKGPQGTLYGRNATGGQINVITRKPDLGETGGYLNGEFGNFGAVKVEGAVNLAMGDDGALRISGIKSEHDGYLSDGTNDEDMYAFRVQMAAEPTENFSINVMGDYAHVGGVGPGVTIQGIDRDDRIGSLDPVAQPYLHALAFPAGSFLGERTGFEPYQDNDYFGFAVEATLSTSIGDITVIPAYRRAEVDFLTCTTQCFLTELDDDQYSFETRLTSNSGGPLDYILGVFYLSEQSHERANYNQDFNAFFADFSNDTDSYAAFGRLTYHLSDAARLTAAGRYTVDKKNAEIFAYNARVVCNDLSGPPFCIGTPPLSPVQFDPLPIFFDGNGDLIPAQPYGNNATLLVGTAYNTPDETFKKFTYRLGFEYDVAPQSMIYGSFETGFKAGGFYNSVDDPVFQPETIDAWTLGSKNRFLNNRLQLNLELFWWEYKDQQISQFAFNSQGGVEFGTFNIGGTRIRGAELELVGKVTPTTTLTGLVQYLDTERRNFVYETPALVGPPPTGCPFEPSDAVFVVDCSGFPAINAPKWSISAGLEQEFDLSDNARLVFNADGRYRSSAYVGNEQLPFQLEKSSFMADLQLKLSFYEPEVYIAGFVNNVTDEITSTYTPFHPLSTSVVFESLSPPRTYGVRVGYNF